MNNNKTISPQRHEDTTNDLRRITGLPLPSNSARPSVPSVISVANNNDQISMTNGQKQGTPKRLLIDHCSLLIEPQRRGSGPQRTQRPQSQGRVGTPALPARATYRRRPACPECRQDARPTNCARAALPYSPNSYLLTPQCSANSYLVSPNSSRHQPRPPVTCNLSPVTSSRRAGFTLVEMLVALSILIILMAAVGEIFSLAGRTVRVGQATLAAMSSIRAVEAQIAHDIHHLDTNGFLVIRQRNYAPYWQTGVQYEPGDEVQYITGGGSQFFLCQQPNTTQAGVAGVPSIPTTVGGGNADWKMLSTTGGYPIWRADQISFIETGNFQSRTGSVQGAETTAAYLTSNKALVWFGQFSTSYGPAGYNFPTPSSIGSPTNALEYTNIEHPFWPQQAWVPLGTPPSGQTSGQYYFGREAMLLIPSGLTPAPGGGTFGSTVYNNPFFPHSNGSGAWDFSTTQNGGSDGKPENIGNNINGGGASSSPESEYATVTSSRLDATFDALPSATITLVTPYPSNQFLVSPYGLGTIEGYASSLPLDPPAYTSLYDIANFFCYRYSTLTTPSASEIGYSGKTPPATSTAVLQQMLNGYYRMTPIMLQGVPSFAVDWTDGGTTVPTACAPAQLLWYGLDDPLPSGTATSPASDGAYLPLYSGAAGKASPPNPEAVYGNSLSPSGGYDGVTYVFYAGNKPAWPKALKITYAVTDPNNRLQGGRFVTQVVELPQ